MNESHFRFDYVVEERYVPVVRKSFNMEESDSVLIRRLVTQGDAEAFSAVVGQYADMVYSTSRRVLESDAQAADVAQETFFQFLKSADRITGSIAGWLHRVATRRAVDLVRQDASRRRREENYATGGLHEVEEWGDIEPLVDEALEELPDELREVLILHYLKGKSMTEIAGAKGLSQPTISRRVATALEQLRQNLRARDVMVGLAVLGTMLASSTQAAPVPVLDALGKIVLALAASSGTGIVSAPAAPVATVAFKVALAAAAVALVTGLTWVAIRGGIRGQPSASAPTPVSSLAPNIAATTDTDAGSTPDERAVTVALENQNRILTGTTPGIPTNDPRLSPGAFGTRSGGMSGSGIRSQFQSQGGGIAGFAGGGGGGTGRASLATSPSRGFVAGGRFRSLPTQGNVGFPIGGGAGRFGVGGMWGGAASFSSRSGSPMFSTNYSFSQSWAFTSGIGSQTQTVFSSGSSPVVPSGRR